MNEYDTWWEVRALNAEGTYELFDEDECYQTWYEADEALAWLETLFPENSFDIVKRKGQW